MQPWQLLKLIHVLSVIVAVGSNVTYAFWLARARRDRDRLVFVMETIHVLDRRIANPAYLVAFVTGAAIVASGLYSFQTTWIALAIALYVAVAVLGITAYAPTIHAQLAAARVDPESAAYASLARRSRTLGWTVTAMVLVIVALMVLKPTL